MGASNDIIYNGPDNDTLPGDAGADTFDGGSGVDTMNGGTKADVYYFAYNDTGLGTAADHIVGFSHTQGDKIEFNMSGIGASGFVGTGAFASGGVEKFGYDKITVAGVKSTVIRIDYDNNGVTDREIVLEGIHIDLKAAVFCSEPLLRHHRYTARPLSGRPSRSVEAGVLGRLYKLSMRRLPLV